jgi:hypothetical protein
MYPFEEQVRPIADRNGREVEDAEHDGLSRTAQIGTDFRVLPELGRVQLCQPLELPQDQEGPNRDRIQIQRGMAQ